MSGIQLFQPNGVGTLNAAGAQHPPPVDVDSDEICQLSFTGSTRFFRWTLSKPSTSASVLSSLTSAGPSFVPDVAGGSYSISLVDENEVEYILDIVTPTTGGGGGGGGGSTVAVALANYGVVRAASFVGGSPPSTFVVMGRAASGDGGEGTFIFVAADTTSPDNDGTILVDADGNRFHRVRGGSLDVRWFGAYGLGADYTANIQAALDEGVDVYVPPGIYGASATLTMDASRQRLFGDGEASVILVLDPGMSVAGSPLVSSYTGVEMNADFTRIDHLSFRGLDDPFFGLVTNIGGQAPIVLCAADDTSVDNCYFRNLYGHVVQSAGATIRNHVRDNVVYQCANGINVSSTGSQQTGNTLEETNGIETSGDDTIISDNNFLNSTGIAVGGRTSGAVTKNVVVSGNKIKDSPAHGIVWNSCSNVLVSGNIVDGVDDHAMHSGRESFGPGPVPGPCMVVGNTIRNTPGHGIWMQFGAGSAILSNDIEATIDAILLEEAGCTVESNKLNGATLDLEVTTLALGTRAKNNTLINDTFSVTGSATFTHPGHRQGVTGTGTTAIQPHTTDVIVTANGDVTIELPAAATAILSEINIENFTQAGITTVTSPGSPGGVAGGNTIVGLAQSAKYRCDSSQWYRVAQNEQVAPDMLSKSVTAGGAIALTLAETNHSRIKFTGSPGGALSVELVSGHAIGWVKTFWNACGQTVTVKASLGDSGVALANGVTATLFSDGTNARDVTAAGVGGFVPTSRTFSGTSPILIDGDSAPHDLSANRTISIDLAAIVPTSRTISTTAPLTGGGDLGANRTLAVSDATTGAVGVVRLTNALGGTGASPEVLKVGGMTVPVTATVPELHVLQGQGTGTLLYGKVPVLLTETISTPPLFNAAGWKFYDSNNSGHLESLTNGGDKCAFILDLPEGYTLTDLEVWIQPPGAHGALPGTMPRFTLTRVDRNTGAATLIDTEIDGSGSVGAYEAYHSIHMVIAGGEVINRATRKYVLNFTAETDANALAGTLIGMIARTVQP